MKLKSPSFAKNRSAKKRSSKRRPSKSRVPESRVLENDAFENKTLEKTRSGKKTIGKNRSVNDRSRNKTRQSKRSMDEEVESPQLSHSSKVVVGEKVHKVLAELGLGSRREVEGWIRQGRVNINQEIAQLGQRVGARDEVAIDGEVVELNQKCSRRVIIYNKPVGEVCTRSDPENRPTVFDHLPKLLNERWILVGRLDINTSGLLLLTTDGELAHKLMHPSTEAFDREYAVRVTGKLTEETCEKLKQGVQLEDGFAKFTDIQYYNGRGVNHWYHVVLMEGRNREVRRLFESQGLNVSRLKRVRFGSVFLPKNLTVGSWCEMDQKGVNQLASIAKLEIKPIKPIRTQLKHHLGRFCGAKMPKGTRSSNLKSSSRTSSKEITRRRRSSKRG